MGYEVVIALSGGNETTLAKSFIISLKVHHQLVCKIAAKIDHILTSPQ
jgi:hypothetical protein